MEQGGGGRWRSGRGGVGGSVVKHANYRQLSNSLLTQRGETAHIFYIAVIKMGAMSINPPPSDIDKFVTIRSDGETNSSP